MPPKTLGTEYTIDDFEGMIKGAKPILTHPVRRVVFKIRSHDQGWGGDPEHQETFHGSWTWFEVGLERFDSTQNCKWEPPSTFDQTNQVPGDEKCELDKQAKDATEPPPLSMCALRTLYPEVRNNEQGLYFHHELHSDAEHKIQGNRTASRDWEDFTITWSPSDDIKADSEAAHRLSDAGRGMATGNGDFVRDLKMGDVVSIWGHARFPGWTNHVEKVGIKIYWAI